MGDFSDNIFLRAAFGGAIEIPETTSSCSPRLRVPVREPQALRHFQMHRKALHAKKLQLKRGNATHHKYSKLEDYLILKAIELKGRDWRTVLAFLKSNLGVLGEEGKIYRDCDIGEKSLQERLRKRASALLNKVKDK